MLVLGELSHHSLTGRLAHHRQTSYSLLFFLLMLTGLVMASVTWSARSDSTCGVPSTPSCEGSYTVRAVVPGPRPSKPAVITSPANGQTFDTNPVTVSGTCPTKSLVKIFTNGVLVGSILCGPSQRFSIPVDLVIGRNELTALPYNAIDQEGPSSPAVVVTLNQPPGGLGFSTELILQSESFYRGTEPGLEIAWPIEIVGGQAPYAVSFDWGDGKTDLITRLAPGPFTLKHTYQKVGGYLGNYPLIIRATDAAGHTAYLQLTTLVNKAGYGGSTSPVTTSDNKLWLIWPIWIVILLMVVSFWLGERREKHIMQKHMEALA